MNPCSRALPELLAPAGSPESFRAAIAAGADAVYLSGKRFGARKFAANFADKEIEEAVRYAHSHGIRIYVTVNTLIHDRELDGALEYLAWLWSAGVDAVLVQDTGLAALAREYLPGLVIHASTQMTIHNADGVRWAAECGFSRVVLARELSLDEVKRIAEETADTGIGLEVFVHGALCYGYSGQCLLSSVIGGRSGNRGMCAQPCRKPYTLVQGESDACGRPVNVRDLPQKETFLLSPKDLCTYRHLPELVRSPVASLKIEGRMKSPEYVAIVVSTYRRALDAIAAGTWTPSEEAYRDLLLAFNRGFTGGYLFGERYGNLMGRDAPDNRGLQIGRVERYDRKTGAAFIHPTVPVIPVPGDGLLIRHTDHPGQERGFALNTIPQKTRGGYILTPPFPVADGSLIYITSSHDLESRARQIVAKPPADLLRPLPVDMEVTVSPEGSFSVTGTIARPDGEHITVSFSPAQGMAPARTRPVTCEQLEEQFRKTGGTPFVVRTCTIMYDGSLFAPVALLNDLRREFFRIAGEQLDASYRPAPDAVGHAREARKPGTVLPTTTVHDNQGRRPDHLRISVYTDSVEGVREAAVAGVDSVIFEPPVHSDRHTCENSTPESSLRSLITGALDECKKTATPLVWKLPRIVHDTRLDQIVPDLACLYENGLGACMSENPGTSFAIRRAAPGMTLLGGSGLNIFNSVSATRSEPHYELLTLSPELSREEIATLVSRAAGTGDTPNFALQVQGNSEALVTEDCIARLTLHCSQGGDGKNPRHRPGFLGIRDETGRIFPLSSDGDCRNRLSNVSEICLIDMLPAIRDAGITDIVIDARHRPPAYIRTMTRLYREAVEATESTTGTSPDGKLRQLKDRAKEISLGGITTGHFLRGLKE